MKAWIEDWFNSQASNSGFLMRRNLAEVHQHVTQEELTADVRRRRWHLLQIGEQYVVICNADPVVVYC